MADALLRMEGIQKSYGTVPVLHGVDFTLAPGEVHALVGENGAGKSTLIKVMTGATRRDGGRMVLDGQEVDFHSPREAQARGVVAVYQEVNLLPRRTVAENLLLGREPRRWGLIDRATMNARARDILAGLGIPIDSQAGLGALPLAQRQLVAIARGVCLGARVLVLDEPTSSLSEQEVAALFALVRRLKADGVAIVYISHRLGELYEVCDRVTVLRDGRHVATRPLQGLERLDLVSLMLGKRPDEVGQAPAASHPTPRPGERPVLRGEGLHRGRALTDVTVEAYRGEIVGLAGLLGSGRTETVRALFGLDPLESGRVEWEGRPLRVRGPRDAIGTGMGLLAEDRKAEGIIPDLSVRENLTLAALPLLSRLGVVSRARQRAVVERMMTRLRIRAASPEQKVRELSGGNQQKVLLARWLCRNPKLLLLDEPTRGVDVGARAEIRELVRESAATGLAVLLVSSDLEEVLGDSTWVVVLRDGRSVTELNGPDVSEANVLRAMADGPRDTPPGGRP